jgi:hypothetical protein
MHDFLVNFVFFRVAIRELMRALFRDLSTADWSKKTRIDESFLKMMRSKKKDASRTSESATNKTNNDTTNETSSKSSKYDVRLIDDNENLRWATTFVKKDDARSKNNSKETSRETSEETTKSENSNREKSETIQKIRWDWRNLEKKTRKEKNNEKNFSIFLLFFSR